MTKEVKSTDETKALVNLSDFSIDKVPQFLEHVNNAIKQLTGDSVEENTTKGVSLTGFGDVNTINSIEQLIKAASAVNAKKEAYEEAAKLVLPEDIKKPAFNLHGISYNNWMQAIKSRILAVNNKEKLNTLQKIKKTLEENLSVEAKLANDMKKIKDLLLK